MSEPKTPASQETKPVREIDEQTQKHIDRFLQGKDVWNKWANEMLTRKAELEKSGKWKVGYERDELNRKKTSSADHSIPEIQRWLDEANVNFSKMSFITFNDIFSEENNSEKKKRNGILIQVFKNEIDFGGFIFPADVDFSWSYFSSIANFLNGKFSQRALFEECEFEKKAVFEDCNFHGQADFRRVQFHGWADFNRATFFKVALFIRAKFQKLAELLSINFKKEVYFLGVEFNGWVKLDYTNFESDVSFNNAAFGNDAVFRSTNIKGEVNFIGAKFIGSSDFKAAVFHKTALFRKTIFNQYVVFDKVVFKEKVYLNAAEFKGSVHFDSTVFIDKAEFSGAVFYDGANFFNTIFHERTYFIQVNFEKHVDLTNAKFYKEVNWGAILVKRAFNLAGTKFISTIPNFTQANFAESPRLDHIEVLPAPKINSPFSWQRYFWQEKYIIYLSRLFYRLCKKYPKYIWSKFTNTRRNPNEEAHYRALKRLAIQAHDHENEMKFFAGEIRARRHITDFMWPWKKGFASSARYWAGVAYELFSDFGRSFIRPALWWFACLWLFANLTLSGTGLVDTTKCHNSQLTPKQAAYTIGLKNSLLILGLTKTNIVKQAELCLYGKNKNGEVASNPKPYDPKIKRSYQVKSTKVEVIKTDIPFKAVVQGITHSLLSLLFIFLLLLAIRNQFKIK